jgi:hypothetical protein
MSSFRLFLIDVMKLLPVVVSCCDCHCLSLAALSASHVPGRKDPRCVSVKIVVARCGWCGWCGHAEDRMYPNHSKPIKTYRNGDLIFEDPCPKRDANKGTICSKTLMGHVMSCRHKLGFASANSAARHCIAKPRSLDFFPFHFVSFRFILSL